MEHRNDLEPGRQLAAETSDVIFGSQATLDGAKRFYADIHNRMPTYGRTPDSLKILPGALVVVGDTVAEAQAKRSHLDSLVNYDTCIPAYRARFPQRRERAGLIVA